MTKYALKSIPKETITVGTIKNLELPKFDRLTLIIGNNNCGKTTLLKYLFLNTKVRVYDDVLMNTSCGSAEERVSVYLSELAQEINDGSIIVMATNNSDVIREFLNYGVKTYRLGKSARNSDQGSSILTEFDYMTFINNKIRGQ